LTPAEPAFHGDGLVLINQYHYALLLFSEEGEAVGSAAVEVDWEPAVQWCRFRFLRRGELPVANGCGTVSILPLWDRDAREPYCRGFRVSILRNGQCPVTSDFPTSYFRRLAAQAAARFVKQGKLETGDVFRYLVFALAAEEAAPAATVGGLQVEEREVPLPLSEASLADWLSRGKPVGMVDPDDMPVFISPRVLEEVACMTQAQRGRETGGILIGNLHRDAAVPEIFAEVTAQVPAEHTRGDAVKLTFTPDTWVAVDNAIKLRGRSEIYLGYWHSHPVHEWCKSRQCTPEKQVNCRLAKDFFSMDDEALLRAIFPRAHSLALVANDTAFAPISFSWFGWREGSIQPRGYYLMGEDHAT
jgi:Prokaryotic homologs of the JAB domain